MLKKIIFIPLVLITQQGLASTQINLHQAHLDSLSGFVIIHSTNNSLRTTALPTTPTHVLQSKNQTHSNGQTITRYQQTYQGLRVIGAQVTITNTNSKSLNTTGHAQVNGQLINDIQMNTTPSITPQKAIDLAKSSYFNSHTLATTTAEISELQIRQTPSKELQLVYLVSFKSIGKNDKPVWPFFIVNAQTGKLTNQWNNIKPYMDSGPGGNEKVHKYWYGKDGLPALPVKKDGEECVMDSGKVKLVNINSIWDWDNKIMTPLKYLCGNNTEENINGAYSPSNDAYYFGHTIVGMYKDWYNTNALQFANGTPMQLIMRVHFGEHYDNAFWDGEAMSFGDGNEFYPLVSLDIAGHEVTHGFTEQHSDLEYHDQSGAINESVSDMAGQASRAYLLESNPVLYNKVHLQPNEITWGIGETITREAFGKALRFMDFPSSDGSSADCLDKKYAQTNGAYCAISYAELIAYAKANIPDPGDRQSYIVHTASGIYNKAFYLLSKSIGIKTAYHAMLLANTKYWTPTTNFSSGSCGVIYAARELSIDANQVKSAFSQVGIDTKNCAN